MKLSEAIRLGAMLRPQTTGEYFRDGGSCAIGAALEATGIADGSRSGGSWSEGKSIELARKYPILTTWMVVRIMWKNDVRKLTREQIADWVASLEPEELAVGEAVHEQTDVRQVPIPRD